MRLKLPSSPIFRAASVAALFAVPAFLTQPLRAQSETPLLATPSVQITAPVANDELVTIKGNTHPLARAQYDRGAASPSLATGRVQMLFQRSPAQAVALREYLGGLQDPNSANFHKWLTPTSYGASFGISNQDLQTVEAWLQSQGFKIESVPASRNLISFSGTTGQIAQAFHTSIHSYVINGVQHYSNTSDPQIPAALAPVVAGLSPLNDFRAKGEHESRARVQVQQQNGSLKPVAQVESEAKPALTGQIGSQPFLFLTPSDVATIYDSPNSFNRNFSASGTTRDGTGVNIGIANYSNLNTTDYANYRHLFLGESSPVAPTIVVDGIDPGVTTDGNGTEALVDTEFSAALAPKANIYLYTSASTLFQDGLTNAAVRAIEDNNVAVLSLSYSNCELFLGQSGNLLFSELWQEAAAQGITVTVAAGDTGSASCDDGDPADTPASDGLTVSGIASTPYDIAVGGTDFDALLSGFTQYVSSTNTALYGSVLGPIPENPWNDSISNNPVGNYTTNTPAEYQSQIILAAGGGGASSAGLCQQTDSNGNCLSPGYPTPPFQSNVNVNGAAPTGVRYLPDVSLFASPGDQHLAAWGLCSDSTTDGAGSAAFDPATGAGTNTYTDCEPAADGSFYLTPLGGTSASSPAFAGVLGLVIQSLGSGTRLGTANNVIYNLANSNYSGIFHDVTLGNNSVPCLQGSLNCETSNNFLTGYNATTNYDLATGLGSVDVTQLVNAWPTANFTPTSTSFQVNGGTAPITIVHGTAVNLSATVAPSSVTGIVSVTGLSGQGGAAVQEYIGLTNGTGAITGVTNLPGSGSAPYNIHAYFPGDVSHGPSTSNSIAVTVTPEASNPFLQVAAVDPSSNSQIPLTAVPYGYATVAEVIPSNANEATVGSHGAATGTVTLFNNGTSYNSQRLNSVGVGEFDLNTLAPGSYSFTASYSGDNSYTASGPTAASPISIVKAGTALTVQASSTSILASAPVTITVQLTTDSIGNSPTGSITLSGNGQAFTAPGPNATVVPAATSTNTDELIATFTVPGAALAAGGNTLTASYSGDGNYNAAANATVAVTVTGGTSTSAGFALTGPTGGITVANPGTAQTGTVTITPTNGFSGTVNLSCVVQFSGTGSAPTCSIAPTINLTANTPATTTVTINTTALASLATPKNGEPGGTPMRRLLATGGGIALCSLLLWGMPARRRSWRSMLAVLLAFGVLGVIGCGGSSNANTGTPIGTYTAVVTASSGSISTNTDISVNVQ